MGLHDVPLLLHMLQSLPQVREGGEQGEKKGGGEQEEGGNREERKE